MPVDPDAVGRALQRVELDIRATTELRDELHVEIAPDGVGFSVHRAGTVLRAKVAPPPSELSIARLAVHLAELIQRDYVMEQAFRAWPRCPVHDHVLEPEMRGTLAMWACPQDGIPPVEIGSLKRG